MGNPRENQLKGKSMDQKIGRVDHEIHGHI